MIDLSIFSTLSGIDLGALSDKPTALTPGQQEAATVLWSSPERGVEIGVWECSPGRFTADRSATAEFCYFLRGRIVMTEADGTRRELVAGDALLLPQGWKGTWEISEHVRKIFVTVG